MKTTWVYIKSESACQYNDYHDLYTVGFYDPEGTWHPESDYNDAQKAAERCHYLNGGGK